MSNLTDEEVPCLKTDDLKKVYGRREVVKGVSLEAKGGEVVGLLGPNGAGKTTTFSMVAGFVSPTSGSVCLNDQDTNLITGLQESSAGTGLLTAGVFCVS